MVNETVTDPACKTREAPQEMHTEQMSTKRCHQDGHAWHEVSLSSINTRPVCSLPGKDPGHRWPLAVASPGKTHSAFENVRPLRMAGGPLLMGGHGLPVFLHFSGTGMRETTGLWSFPWEGARARVLAHLSVSSGLKWFLKCFALR